MQEGHDRATDHLAQTQSGRGRVPPQSTHEGARELHRKRDLGIPDRDRSIHVLRTLEVPVCLAFRHPTPVPKFVGGVGLQLVSSQQLPRKIEPLGLLGLGRASHVS